MMTLTPVTLHGRHVRLEPLSAAHLADLADAGADPEIWRWYATTHDKPEAMASFIRTALELQQSGSALPFATIDRATGRAVGSSRFANVSRVDRRAEIGWTWLNPGYQRTAANTEAKYLMLTHAFEELGCIRVEFKTDMLNAKSRAALLRIGAREEGVFRNHMLCWDGRVRHSVYYSIIESEWPNVKAGLERNLTRGARAA
jgi:RimJ/RimL family protein N-acetyltransferase